MQKLSAGKFHGLPLCNVGDATLHSALILAPRITLPHFSVSSAISLPNWGRHFEAERLRGFEVDSQFELRWLLNGKINRLVSIENTGSVNADLAILALTESGLLPAEQ